MIAAQHAAHKSHTYYSANNIIKQHQGDEYDLTDVLFTTHQITGLINTS